MKKKLKEFSIKMKAETKSVSKRRKSKVELQSAESMERGREYCTKKFHGLVFLLQNPQVASSRCTVHNIFIFF